jgi:hypothetical protein
VIDRGVDSEDVEDSPAGRDRAGTIRGTKRGYELFAAITGLRFTATVSVQNVES